jgi:hypothetical protein
LTSKSLLKFNSATPFTSEKYPISKLNGFFVRDLQYDIKSNEILFKDNYLNVIWYFDIENKNWESFDVVTSGIKGKLLALKKLYDENLYASDDLGYLYKYLGKGQFQQLDLSISGKPNLGFAINDISMNGNKVMYLATEIGLFYNDNFVGVEDNETEISEQISISPNPASNYILINSPFFKGGQGVLEQIRIFDVFGNCVLTVETQNFVSLQTIDISTLPAGVYFVRIGDKVEKFIKL